MTDTSIPISVPNTTKKPRKPRSPKPLIPATPSGPSPADIAFLNVVITTAGNLKVIYTDMPENAVKHALKAAVQDLARGAHSFRESKGK
jgi:hypothetical protein